MTTRIPSQCWVCQHFRSPLDGPDIPEQTCDAYPDGIPDPIWNMQVDHRKPASGDHGIQFEVIPGREYPEYALEFAKKIAAARAESGG